MKRERCEIDELVSGLEELDVMENAEYELLVEAFESKLNQKNINEILQKSYERYSRYIEKINFDEIEELQDLIIDYLDNFENRSITLEERFACMKEIVTYFIKIINGVGSSCKKQKIDDMEIEMEM
jgi:type I site-specific restriction endonuclease